MDIEIGLKDNKVSIIITQKGNIISQKNFENGPDLSQKLLAEIDALLKESRLKKSPASKIKTSIETSEFLTSSRIIKAVSQSFNFAQKNKSRTIS